MNVLDTARSTLFSMADRKKQWFYDNPTEHDFNLYGEMECTDDDGEAITMKDMPTLTHEFQIKKFEKVNALVRHRVHLNNDEVIEVVDRKKDWFLITRTQKWHLKCGRFGWYLELKKNTQK